MREAGGGGRRFPPSTAWRGGSAGPGTAGTPLPPVTAGGLAGRPGTAAGGGAVAPGTKTPRPGRTTYFRGRPRRSGGAAGAHTHARAAPALPSPGLPSVQLAEMCKILNKLKQRRKGQGARRRGKPRARREVGAARRPPRCKRRPTTRSRCSRLIRRGAGLGGGAAAAAAAPPGTPTPAPAG